jgi:hypothetical protein
MNMDIDPVPKQTSIINREAKELLEIIPEITFHISNFPELYSF